MKSILAALLVMQLATAFADTEQTRRNNQAKVAPVFDIKFDSEQRKIFIKKGGGIYQIIDLESAPPNDAEITISDYNFDGIDDIGIAGDQGNVERFFNIFLFSKQTKKFEHSKSLSSIPCLMVDSRKRELVGQCFHASACENWTETYTIRKHDALNLIEKKGYSCDPSTNSSFRYIEKYRNGRLLFNSIVEVK